MLENNIRLAWRNFTNKISYSLINIVGLSVGLACCLITFLYFQNETHYDVFHSNAERIFRVGQITESNGERNASVSSQIPLGPALQKNISGVETAIRFWRSHDPVVGWGTTYFNEHENLFFTDDEVFETFSFNLLKGNPSNALEMPGSLVLSESVAKKYFGDEDPIGKVLEYNGYPDGELELTVTGVMEDLPSNTQFDFTMLASLNGIETEKDNWGSRKPVYTYVFLEKNAQKEAVEAAIPSLMREQFDPEDIVPQIKLEALSEVHLYSQFSGGMKPGNNIGYLYIFGFVAFSILVLAVINFINMGTARSSLRATEIGVRKTLGASRTELIGQFLSESFLMVAFSQIFSIGLVWLAGPVLQKYLGLEVNIGFLLSYEMILFLSGICLIVTAGAGIYNAFVMSGFSPVKALKAETIQSGNGWLKKGLIVFQFSVSIVFIITTLIVRDQMDYIQNKRLGFDKENMVVLPYSENEIPLINELESLPYVTGVTVSQRVPVNNYSFDNREIELEGTSESYRAESIITDARFLKAYEIELLAGRGFDEEKTSDDNGFIINEAAVKEFGFNQPGEVIGLNIRRGDYSGPIIGVIRDFHLNSMRESINPTVILQSKDTGWWEKFISVKLSTNDTQEALAQLESTWKKYTPKGVYSYFFIEESLKELHQQDQQVAEVFSILSVLALFIAGMGLLGLLSFVIVQRKKEIAIRKVFGAGIGKITLMLNKDFLIYIVAGFFISVPVSWFIINRWLQNFAYKTDINVFLVVLAGLICIFMTGVLVSFQSWKAASTNPAKVLRDG